MVVLIEDDCKVGQRMEEGRKEGRKIYMLFSRYVMKLT